MHKGQERPSSDETKILSKERIGLSLFIEDLKALMIKIESNEETLEDYKQLHKMFKLADIPDEIIDGYKGCGFQSLEDYFQTKKKGSIKTQFEIDCAVSKLRGISNGIINVLSHYLSVEEFAKTKQEHRHRHPHHVD